MTLIDKLEHIGLCKEEFLILKAIVLANSDCLLEDQTAIDHLKETLLSSFHDAVNSMRFVDFFKTKNYYFFFEDLEMSIYTSKSFY